MASFRHCPGRYCGRLKLLDNATNAVNEAGVCGACPRGFRADEASFCSPCVDSPPLYDWLYLGFIAALPLLLNLFFIEFSARRKATRKVLWAQRMSAVVECVFSALVSVLVASPSGSFGLAACRVQRLSDWYTIFFNPRIRYTEQLKCTQEAVYPLYSLPFIYYILNLALIVVIRLIGLNCIFGKLFRKSGSISAIFAALYFYPILMIIHSAGAGFIYYAFPYILMIACLIVNVLHLTAYDIQTCSGILKNTVLKSKNCIAFCLFSAIYAYSIISVTRFNDFIVFTCFAVFIPLPTIFYAFTSALSEPSRLSKVC